MSDISELLLKFNNCGFVDCSPNINIINTPSKFYNKILDLLNTSEEVYIVTLYLGIDKLSEKIKKGVEKRKNNGKITKIIVDYNRAARTPELWDDIKKRGLEDSFIFYNPMDQKLQKSLLQSFKLPSLIGELLCVLHLKFLIFDNQVIITGCNLSESYFTNRLDRYYLFDDIGLSKTLKSFFNCLVTKESISNFHIKNMMINNQPPKSNTCLLIYDNKLEFDILKRVFEYDFDEIMISSAYLNFPKSYIPILNVKKLKILVQAPHLNKCTASKVLNRNVTEAYSYFIYETEQNLPECDIYEYRAKDMGFHCKGVWGFKDNLACTIIGSSNFNNRSLNRDLELNFLLITSDAKLVNKIRTEYNELLSESKHKERGKFRTGWITWAFLAFIRGFL